MAIDVLFSHFSKAVGRNHGSGVTVIAEGRLSARLNIRGQVVPPQLLVTAIAIPILPNDTPKLA